MRHFPDPGSARRFSDGEAASRVLGALSRAAPAGAGSASIDFEFLKTVIVAPLSPDLGVEKQTLAGASVGLARSSGYPKWSLFAQGGFEGGGRRLSLWVVAAYRSNSAGAFMTVPVLRLMAVAGASALALTACSKDNPEKAPAAPADLSAAAPNTQVTARPRETRTVPVDIQGVTDVGATVRVKNVDLAEDATIVDVSISFGGDRTNNVQMASTETYIELPNGQKLMLKAPEGNPNMNIIKGDTMNGRLVFMGAVPRGTQQISLVFNEGSSSDSIIGPFLRMTIPLTSQAAGAPG